MSQHHTSNRFGRNNGKSRVDRRAADRYRCNLNIRCQVFGRGEAKSWAGIIHNLSRTGMRLILPAKVQARMILEVMPQARRDGGQPGCIIVRVRNIIPHHDGTWLVGCGLVKPRTEEELDALLNVCSDGRA